MARKARENPFGVIRALLEAGSWTEVLAAASGDGAGDPPPVIALRHVARARALAALERWSDAEAAFLALLALPPDYRVLENDPAELAILLRHYPETSRTRLAGAWVAWVAGHAESGRTVRVSELLRDVPLATWTAGLLFRALEEVIPLQPRTAIEPMLAEGRRRDPVDPRLVRCEEELARREAMEARRLEAHRRAARREPARLASIEAALAVRIPPPLLRAWERALEGEPRPANAPAWTFLPLAGRTVEEFLALVAGVRDQTGPVLPFAQDPSGRFLALYLAQPRPDGDFAVLAIADDARVVALSTAELLAPGPELRS